MAKAEYINVGGVAKKVKNQYICIGGVSKNVKSGYICKDGVAKQFFGISADPVLANNDWATIAAVSESGQASSIWKVGDEKNITVNGETLTLVILGFNHDDLASGDKAGITFGLKHLMNDTRQMNSSRTNSGAFAGSAMYTWLQNTLLNSLPSDLQLVIKSVNKTTYGNTNAMKIFLPSELEVIGQKRYSDGKEGTQYSYFTETANRIKRLSNGAGSEYSWWTRSPYAQTTQSFCQVNNLGTTVPNFAEISYGVCFCFCV